MNNTTTPTTRITTKDGPPRTLVVKSEFLAICPNPNDYKACELAVDFNIVPYMHNTKGPASEFKIDGEYCIEYWENGQILRNKKYTLARLVVALKNWIEK